MEEQQKELDEETKENYIIIYFGKDVSYDESGFAKKIASRQAISSIKLENAVKEKAEALEIKANSKVEIHFDAQIKSLENFFSKGYDANTQHLVSADLSHFDASELTSFLQCFSECASLTTFIKPNNVTSKLTTMSTMFYMCQNIISNDISNFQTENVKNIDYLFYECSSVKSIDMSNVNFESVQKYGDFLDSSNNLKYINLKNFKYNKKWSNNLIRRLNSITNLIICGATSDFTAKDICCNYDIVKDKCDDDSNYITVHYDMEETNHQFSLACSECLDNVGFLKVRENMLSKNDKFNLTKETKLEIHFANPLVNVSNFFSGTEKIKSIDLSTLNSSKISDMSYIFNGCSSLESINLKNLNTSLVTNMSSMFVGCSSLNLLDLSNFDTKSSTNLEKMFYNCKNIKELNLSSFNTPLLTNMNEIFNGCTSLASLDISNFDMKNCINYENIFSDISSIKYINLHYFKNDKIFFELFKEATDIIVCQSDEIIKSSNAIYCCDYDFTANKCLEPIPTTIFSTKYIEHITTTIEQTIINTTITIALTSIPTTQINIDISVTLVLIGFSNFRNSNNNVSFYIYFYCTNDLFYSEDLKFPIVITSNRVLRELETFESICKITDEKKKNIYTYFCQVQTQIKNLKSFQINDINSFQFYLSNIGISFKNIEVIASPLAEIFMDNLQLIPNELDTLRNSTYYILNNSKINGEEKLYFNITGKADPKPKFGKSNIKLMTFTKTGKEIFQREINCSIIDLINNNYTLKCKGNNNEYYNLQNALSINNDEILIIIFDDGDNSTISFEAEKEYRVNLSNKKRNLSAGVIVAIILVILFAIASIIDIAIYICFRKEKNIKDDDSTVKNL